MKIANWYLKISPFSRFIVHGQSMLPTLNTGDNVLVFNWAYFFKKPQAGDVVVVKMDGKYMVKRIQELAGSRVFLMGDNKQGSTDSRQFGWVDRMQITGKIVWYLN